MVQEDFDRLHKFLSETEPDRVRSARLAAAVGSSPSRAYALACGIDRSRPVGASRAARLLRCAIIAFITDAIALRFLWIVERHFCELGLVDV
jgi:hypothetical protein